MFIRLKKVYNLARGFNLGGKNFIFLPAILRHYYRSNIVRDKYTITGIEISVDFRCNNKCAHCATSIFSEQLKQKAKDKLTTNEIKVLIDQTKELYGFYVVFIGGEPLMREDIEDLINYAHHKRLMPWLFTNATLIDRTRAKRLRQAGLVGATISIHGSHSQPHDLMTLVPGSYRRTIKGISYLLKEGLYVRAGLVPTRHNIRSGEFEKILLWCEEKKIDVKLNRVMPVGMLGSNATDSLLEPTDAEIVENMMRKHSWISDDMITGRGCRRCPAGNYTIEISEFGDVFPCFFIHISYGNIRETSLIDIVRKMRESPFFNNLKHGHCVAATDKNFIDNYLSPLWSAKNYPLRLEDHPMYNRNRYGDYSL